MVRSGVWRRTLSVRSARPRRAFTDASASHRAHDRHPERQDVVVSRRPRRQSSMSASIEAGDQSRRARAHVTRHSDARALAESSLRRPRRSRVDALRARERLRVFQGLSSRRSQLDPPSGARFNFDGPQPQDLDATIERLLELAGQLARAWAEGGARPRRVPGIVDIVPPPRGSRSVFETQPAAQSISEESDKISSAS